LKDREWVELIEKSEIENAIHKENKLKFTQMNLTPAMMELLVSDLRFLGDIECYNQILAGTYQPSLNINQYAKAFLKKLVKSRNIVNLPRAYISTDSFHNR